MQAKEAAIGLKSKSSSSKGQGEIVKEEKAHISNKAKKDHQGILNWLVQHLNRLGQVPNFVQPIGPNRQPHNKVWTGKSFGNETKVPYTDSCTIRGLETFGRSQMRKRPNME